MRRALLSSSFILCLVGCGGSGSVGPAAGPVPVVGPAGSPQQAPVSIVIPIPSRSAADLDLRNHVRHASYVSTYTQSAVVSINSVPQTPVNAVGPSITLGPYVVNLGSNTFSIVTYAGLNGTGAPLSSTTQTATIVAGPNNLTYTLSGIPGTAITVALANQTPPLATAPLPINETVTVLDAAGGSINGPLSTAVSMTTPDATNLALTAPSATTSPYTNTVTYSGACIPQSSFGATAGSASGSVTFGTNRVSITNSNDSGTGSLRAAMGLVPSGGIIVNAIGTPSTISLASTLPTITSSMSICGSPTANRGDLTINGNGTAGAFTINTGPVTIKDMTISNGTSGVNGNAATTISNLRIGPGMTGSAVSANPSASVSVSNSDLSNNSGYGLNITGTATVTNSSICYNTGGGIYFYGSSFSMTNSTVCNNSTGYGGGLYLVSGSATILSSTFTANNASGSGGNIYISGGSLSMKATIVANGTASTGSDIYGTWGSNNYNLISNSSGWTATGTTANNIVNVNPLLNGPTTVNGTTIFTLSGSSPAINQIPPVSCPPADQVGVVRPHLTANCAIGSSEP